MRLWRSEVFIAGLLQSVMFEVEWCELWGRGRRPFIPRLVAYLYHAMVAMKARP